MNEGERDPGRASTAAQLMERVLRVPPVAPAELIRTAVTIEKTLQRIRAEPLPDLAWEGEDQP
jgi:hypothetical protein